MGCGAAEATVLGFVCFVVINPCMFSANRVDSGFFVSSIFQLYSTLVTLIPHYSDVVTVPQKHPQ
mgnify:CR=1 FL=1